MSKPVYASELIGILRFFVYADRKVSDNWISRRSLYGALAKLIREARRTR